MSRSLQSNVIRGSIAAVLLACLAAFVGTSLFPDMPIWKVLLYALAAAAAAFAVGVAVVAASLQFRQFVLRKGATDPQWFWFPSEPKGLLALREEAGSAADAEKAA